MDIYLHHYPASLFSEKVRLLLGYLKLPWHSVETSNIMPRPLLMPLTGGYRKTPSLQIGANVYCDTAVIARGLVRHTGNTELFNPGFNALRVAEWADSQLFRITVALNFRPEALGAMMGQFSSTDLEAFMKDRAELTGDAPISSFTPAAALAYIETYLTDLEASVDGHFLFGDKPSIADFSVYHCLWFLANNPVNAALLEPYTGVKAWCERMAAFGHGQFEVASGEDALAAAKAATPIAPKLGGQPLGSFAIGDEVSVTPADYGRIAVQGRLVAWDAQEVVLARDTSETGPLMTHFPSAGFEVGA
jgi:glutathione S-transferase